MRPILLAFALALAAPAALFSQNDEDARWLADCRERDDDDERYSACEILVESLDGPAASIRIEPSENGGAIVRGWDQPRMEVHLKVRARGATPAEAAALARRVRLEMSPGLVRAIGPEDEDGWSATPVVYIPRRRDVQATTVNGPLAVEDVEGTLRLRTSNGPLALENVGGDVEARAVNGPLHVVLGGTTWRGRGLDARTENGPVHLEIPEGYSAALETGTVNGPFSTDIPLTIEPGDEVGRRITARLGGGGPPVRVTTTNGPVKIESR